MNVDKSKTRNLGSGHSIEVGGSTWDENEMSIRNRYSTSTGRFNQAGSSELPIDDIFQITKVAAEEDLLHSKTLIELIEIFSASLKRQVN